MRPTDKAACERAFAGIQSLLLEMLLGYRGVDVADRGADPEGDAVWTLAEMEHLLATWIVSVWQNRRLDQYAPAWDPGGRHSPNTLFAAAAARDGISLEIPEPDQYYELLPTHYVKIDRRRGVKIGGLWYGGDAAVLDPYRGQRSARSGRHAGKWAINRDPRDCRESTSKTPSTLDAGTLWTGTGCRAERTSRSSPTRGSANSSAKRPGPALRRAMTGNCCRCCWSCSPHGPRWPSGRRR
ncbi:hypothetical protein FH609_022460 [Streptomyces sp. 3MP-14]|uniref:Uncharacterized protein n=1 Tax=Streptomyces mimosae TaxID=2586635 RepID=A0A5N6A198_9ACTN|nr:MULTISPECIES: hypothetical protein [Streptomyces]KAB8162537.1 hypothetical protein FH607_021050 [Streptomyces mimosae]KAB8174364.1 hypothetical protein FH609_022460 [Streptomyces sp. 3MP-14]